jgi:hypothetical protein
MDVVEVDWCEEKKREQGRGKRGILISTVLDYSFTWVVYVWDTLKQLWRKHKQCLK